MISMMYANFCISWSFSLPGSMVCEVLCISWKISSPGSMICEVLCISWKIPSPGSMICEVLRISWKISSPDSMICEVLRISWNPCEICQLTVRFQLCSCSLQSPKCKHIPKLTQQTHLLLSSASSRSPRRSSILILPLPVDTSPSLVNCLTDRATTSLAELISPAISS